MRGLPRITAITPAWLTEITCQRSYPLNSENDKPPGTFRRYLSCAAVAAPFAWPSAPEAGRAKSELLVRAAAEITAVIPMSEASARRRRTRGDACDMNDLPRR